MASDSERDSLVKADDENHFPVPSDLSLDTVYNKSVNIDDQEDFTFYLRGGRMLKFGRVKLNIILSVFTVISNVMMVVSLPLFSGTVDQYNDEYPVILYTAIWFPVFFFGLVALQKFLAPATLGDLRSIAGNWREHGVNAFVGFLNACNGILVVYASDPSRTSPSLQALLSTSIIPFTVVCRYIILRKGVSRARLICTGIVLIGLFISLEPEIFNIHTDNSDDNSADSVGSSSSSVWPFIFVLGFLPLGILNTFIEKQLKKDETESLVFLSWVQLFSAVFIGLFFWTDFIPKFGAAGSWDQFKENMIYGINCMYGQGDSSCENAVIAYWVFIISYCLANLMVFVLVRFSEGAVYLVVVQAITTPLGSLFFTFFQATPKFHWGPVFNITVAFRLVGLCIIVPAVVFYNYFGEKERRRVKDELKTLN